MDTLLISRFHFETTFFCGTTIFFAKPLWIRYEFAIKSLWNHYEIKMNSLSASRFLFEFTIFIANSLSVPQIHLKSTIYFANYLWIQNLLRDFTMNSPSFSQNHCEFTIYFENLLLIHYLFRDISLNSLSVKIYYIIRLILWVINLSRMMSLWVRHRKINT